MRFQLASPAGDLFPRARVAAARALGRHSLVARCGVRASLPGLPPLSIHVARGARRSARPGQRHVLDDVLGMGVSDSDDQSWIKAVVEAVERYSMATPHDPSTILRASMDEVAEWAVPLDRFQLYSDAQYAVIPTLGLPEPEDAIDWTWAYSMTTGSFVLVPAALLYGSLARRPPNNFVESMTSTGMACHVSIEAAALAGLLEVVERDAVMISWLNHRIPARITIGRSGPLADLFRERFTLPGVEFVLLDLSSDVGIATIGCLAFSERPEHPAAAMGSASRLDPVEAAKKALFEAAQVMYAAHDMGWTQDEDFPETDVRTIAEHSRFYAGAEAAQRLDFMVSGSDEIALADLPDLTSHCVGTDLVTAVERVSAVGLDVLVADVTCSDVAQSGFRTVRTLVPGAVDINGDVRFPHLGSERIGRVPRAVGWSTTPGLGLNLAPCPLA
ncbi:MAG: YcaO-like family protein [Actinomycetota bacterium]|nr:YcaO-like family protein [Actinomycetota bacterium]